MRKHRMLPLVLSFCLLTQNAAITAFATENVPQGMTEEERAKYQADTSVNEIVVYEEEDIKNNMGDLSEYRREYVGDSTRFKSAIQTPDGTYGGGGTVGANTDKTRTSPIGYTTPAVKFTATYPGTNTPRRFPDGRIMEIEIGYSTVNDYGDVTYNHGGIDNVKLSNGLTQSLHGASDKQIVAAWMAADPSGQLAAEYLSGQMDFVMTAEKTVTIYGEPLMYVVFDQATGTSRYEKNPNVSQADFDKYVARLGLLDGEFPIADQYNMKTFVKLGWNKEGYLWDSINMRPIVLGLLTDEEIQEKYPDLWPLIKKKKEWIPDMYPDEEIPKDILPEGSHLSGSAYPTYMTWHEANSHRAMNGQEYILREGIPSNEMVMNHIEVDDWYGMYDWEYQTGRFKYTIEVTANYYYWEWEDHGDGTGGVVRKVGGKKYDVDVVRPWGYYYSPYIELYHQPEVTVDNPAYSYGSGTIQYGQGPKLGAESVYEEPTLPLYNGHVEEPEWEPTASCGIYGSAAAISISDVIAAAEDAVGKVKSQNDLLDVDGHLYMTGVLREDYDTTIYEAEDHSNPIEVDPLQPQNITGIIYI